MGHLSGYPISAESVRAATAAEDAEERAERADWYDQAADALDALLAENKRLEDVALAVEAFLDWLSSEYPRALRECPRPIWQRLRKASVAFAELGAQPGEANE